jgi:4-hydroxybenzoate polyprenyltransferase
MNSQAVLQLLRAHQWLKNSFVYIGPLFAHRWDIETLGLAAIAFVCFCLAASAVYVFNDILDVEADRAHPTKRQRPLASGALSIRAAWWISGTLAMLAFGLAWLVSPWVLGFVLAYAVLNIGYSVSWKHVAVLDVFIISAGFMLRILCGTVGLEIEPSSWLLLTGLMMTLFLGFAKRRAELLSLAHSGVHDHAVTRRVLDHYNPQMIELYMGISAACTIMTYSLYTVSPDTVARHGTEDLIYTVPLVVYGIFRYVYLLHLKGKGNDTARDLYSDSHLFVTALIWLVATLMVLA